MHLLHGFGRDINKLSEWFNERPTFRAVFTSFRLDELLTLTEDLTDQERKAIAKLKSQVDPILTAMEL